MKLRNPPAGSRTRRNRSAESAAGASLSPRRLRNCGRRTTRNPIRDSPSPSTAQELSRAAESCVRVSPRNQRGTNPLATRVRKSPAGVTGNRLPGDETRSENVDDFFDPGASKPSVSLISRSAQAIRTSLISQAESGGEESNLAGHCLAAVSAGKIGQPSAPGSRSSLGVSSAISSLQKGLRS